MADTDPSPNSTPAQRRTVAILVAGVFLFALAIGIYAIKVVPGGTQVANALSLSAVVLTGLTLVVVLMAGLVLIYSYTDVTNENQALALPEGSVRALLAFSLVVIFVAIAAFLYSNVNAADLTLSGTHDRLTEAEINDLKTQFVVIYDSVLITDQDKGKQCVAPRESAKQGNTAADGIGTPGTSPDQKIPPSIAPKYVDCQTLVGTQALNVDGKPVFKASVYIKRTKDSDDFAKLIFTTLSGVFISVVSFYFGSSTTSSAVAAGVRATGRDPNPAAQRKADADEAKAKTDADAARAAAQVNARANLAPADNGPAAPPAAGAA